MPSGGYRPGSGPSKGTKYGPRKKKEAGAEPLPPENLAELGDPNFAADLSPLEFLLKIMRSPTLPLDVRLRAATLAAPYSHAKSGSAGKKEQKQDRAKQAASGKFAAGAPPMKLVKG